MGRCAGYILREEGKNVVSAFIYDSEENRIKRTMSSLNVTQEAAAKVLKQTDKARRSYHKHYTGLDWNDPSQYDLMLNSGSVPFDKCVDLICDLYNG